MVFAALIARITRASMLDVLSQDYIRTAQAKGLSSEKVLIGHALKNAAVPIVTIIGIGVALLIGGVVVTETVFAIPGLGRVVEDDFAVGADDLRHEDRILVDTAVRDRPGDVRHLERRDRDDAEDEREHPFPFAHRLAPGDIGPHTHLLCHLDDLVQADTRRETNEGAVHRLGRRLLDGHHPAAGLEVRGVAVEAGGAASGRAVDLVVARIAVLQDGRQGHDLEARPDRTPGAVDGEIELGLAVGPAVDHRLQ